jgi:hypothetical protein
MAAATLAKRPPPSANIGMRTRAIAGRTMTQEAGFSSGRRLRARALAGVLLLGLSACSHLSDSMRPTPKSSSPRAQLSVGYSLLYQEADGIPKLKWILMFKDKSSEMSKLTADLVSYYQELADHMQQLAKQYPGMRIDVTTMPPIESDMRKAIGTDQAKDMAPVVGKSGIEFEREALLMFSDALNEQRHLVAVMQGLETDPGLSKFLATTKEQLDTRYERVGALLNHRYFTH